MRRSRFRCLKVLDFIHRYLTRASGFCFQLGESALVLNHSSLSRCKLLLLKMLHQSLESLGEPHHDCWKTFSNRWQNFFLRNLLVPQITCNGCVTCLPDSANGEKTSLHASFRNSFERFLSTQNFSAAASSQQRHQHGDSGICITHADVRRTQRN